MKKMTFKTCVYILLCLLTHQLFAQGVVSSLEKKVIIQENENINLIPPNNGKIRYNGKLYSVITETQAYLYRYSKDYLDNGMDGTLRLDRARTQPGISISFKTNSPLVKLKFANLENSKIGEKRFSVFKNGKLVFDNISDLEFTVENPTKDISHWEVYLPYYSGVTFLGMELARGHTLYELPVEDKPLYMAIGNSITHGFGQSGTIDTYPYQVADALGFRHINLATAGSLISSETLRNFNHVSPRLITILWGYNDVNREKPLLDVMPVYESLVSNLCSDFPQADMYCILQTFTPTVVGKRNDDNRIDSLRSWTRSIVKKLQKKHSNLHFIDGADYVTSEADLIDVVHLNVQGAQKLARGIVAEYHANSSKHPDSAHSKMDKTQVLTNENGEVINMSQEDILRFKANGFVRYSEFGAKGDGKIDDIGAIAATHEFANLHGLVVKADEGATYYIGGTERTVVIQTNTDFGTAAFIIDDTEVQNYKASIFMVSSNKQSFKLEGVSSLVRNQEKMDASLPGTCLITATNSNISRYIRFGPNQGSGSPQTDIFIVDKNGHLDKDAPIIWDFDQITDITALPIDETTLTITGGRFTTIANNAESKYTYYSRGLIIKRSNVIVDGLEHRVTGEGDHVAPYRGFIDIRDCSYVTVKNTILTGHKTYGTIGSAGVPVSMGSYDISVNRALNVSFVNCSQTNDINDRKFWGIMSSNYCKNLVYDNCTLSRFDAHMGVANATIRNSTLGHQGINAIGSGRFTVKNTTVRARSLINLRPDYGSTWQGEFVIRNCTFIPTSDKPDDVSVISGSYSGQHDFGYTCYMPEHITIENLYIDDSKYLSDYQAPTVFGNFNPDMSSKSYLEKFPYVITKKVLLKNVTTASGKDLRISDNLFMFKDVQLAND